MEEDIIERLNVTREMVFAYMFEAIIQIGDLREENKLLRELLQQWLGNCFVDTHGQGVTFGMGVKKVWEETRAALKEGE